MVLSKIKIWFYEISPSFIYFKEWILSFCIINCLLGTSTDGITHRNVKADKWLGWGQNKLLIIRSNIQPARAGSKSCYHLIAFVPVNLVTHWLEQIFSNSLSLNREIPLPKYGISFKNHLYLKFSWKISLSAFYMRKKFKHTTKLTGFYRLYPCIYHLDCNQLTFCHTCFIIFLTTLPTFHSSINFIFSTKGKWNFWFWVRTRNTFHFTLSTNYCKNRRHF